MPNPESLFSVLFEQAAVGMVLVDQSGHVLKTNRTLQAWFGYSAIELQAMSFDDYTFAEDISIDHHLFEELAQGTRSYYQVEKRYVRKNGAVVWGRVTVSLIHPVEGEPILVLRMIEDIEQRKQIEQAVQTSEAPYRALFERTDIGVMITDIEGRLLESNQVLQAMLELTGDELHHVTFLDLTRSDDITTDQTLFQGLVEGQQDHYQVEKRLRRKDGSFIWVKTTVYTVQASREYPQFAIIMAEDITNRKQTEEAFHNTYRAYRMLSLANQIVIRASSEIQLLQETCEELVKGSNYLNYLMAWVGFAQQDESKSVYPAAYAGHEAGYLAGAAITWADTERGRGPTGTAIRTGQPCAAQYIFTDPAFEPWRAEALRHGYASSIAIPLLAGGQAFGTLNIYASEPNAFAPDEIALLQELTNVLAFGIMAIRTRELRLRAEHALETSETRYRHIVDTTHEGIWVIDAEANTIFVNQKMADMLGYTIEEMVGRPLFAFVDDKYQMEATALLNRHRQGMAEQHDFLFRRKDGSALWALISTGPYFDDEGHFAGALAMINDITERKKAEEALRHRTNRLEIQHKIDQAILAAQSPKTVAQEVLRDLAELVPADYVSITLFDTDLNKLLVLASYDPERKVEELDRPISPNVIEVLKRGEIYFAEDLLALPDHSAGQARLIKAGIRTHFNVPLTVDGKLIGSLNVASTKADSFSAEHIEIVREVTDSLAIAIQQAGLLEEIQRTTAHLRSLTSRLAEAEEIERRRLRRELHDRVGQNLAALGLHLTVIRSQLPEATADQVQHHLTNSLDLVEQTTEIIRDVMANLSPPVLDDYGLLAALGWYGKRFVERTGVAVSVQGEEPDPRLAPHRENELFRIAQEALTNVTKHAQATQVTITVETLGEMVRLVIADDGVGFDPLHRADSNRRPGWGLLTMAERAGSIGGQYRIESQPGEGTRVIVEVTR